MRIGIVERETLLIVSLEGATRLQVFSFHLAIILRSAAEFKKKCPTFLLISHPRWVSLLFSFSVLPIFQPQNCHFMFPITGEESTRQPPVAKLMITPTTKPDPHHQRQQCMESVLGLHQHRSWDLNCVQNIGQIPSWCGWKWSAAVAAGRQVRKVTVEEAVQRCSGSLEMDARGRELQIESDKR